MELMMIIRWDFRVFGLSGLLVICGRENRLPLQPFVREPVLRRLHPAAGRRHLTVRILEDATAVPFPESGCKARMKPEWCHCQGILPGEVFERWSAVVSEAAISAGDLVYCLYGDCWRTKAKA
ncbi:hypothetical protein EJ110_NYTH31011 [Nymphaea thermarum]|nr:hypothetical protein EJ110_NYTH31011 [Nymphaea thermarum]